MTYVNYLLIVLLLASWYCIYNLLRKLEFHEDFIESILNELRDVLATIKAVDIRGSFEADDEVGDTFKQIKTTIEVLEKFTSPQEQE